jgi:tetratricopeptide (TPR) repeat protein
VQDDIAQSVVKELRAALLTEKPDASASAAVKAEVRAATKGRSENVEAYRLYLQGRFFHDRLTGGDTAKAMLYYRQALELDPQYALAWSGVSRCYGAGYPVDMAVPEGSVRAREAAERALQLEPDLTEAHVALGLVRVMHDWDWKGADASFRRALELTPGDAQVLRSRGLLTANLGRQEEAIALIRRAIALDPLSVAPHRILARLCIFDGALEEAEAAAKKALELNPQGGMTNFWVGLIRMMQGGLEEALEIVQRETHETFRLVGLTLVQRARGRHAESDAALQELIEKHAAGGAYQIAEAYAYRGETDLAFEWLERAYTQRDPGTGMVRADPLLRSLSGDPRWRPFLNKMGLSD